ncbi:hypothetical protein AAFC00_001560 [Neodothiora populina]|uniref:Uncharacterized protein n=1 Tax=Neodothiora populina TaxID=2781224 RepID=A0ABR3PPK3_9PEZI
MSEIEALLRFLTKDAKLPLGVAMQKITELREAGLTNPQQISRSTLQVVSSIFDEKNAKSVFNASKRIRKRSAEGNEREAGSSNKKRRSSLPEVQTPAKLEASLALPLSSLTAEELSDTVLTTNRAPLLLAFAYSVLAFTMPDQPDSAKLSLAQAVVSAGSKAKAISIGLAKADEDRNWGEGQPSVKVLGQNIKVIRRWGYEISGEDPALWALDMDQVQGPLTAEHTSGETTGLPIYSPQSARSYIKRAFGGDLEKLLKVLSLLYQSWADALSTDDLDKRAWSCYVKTRPDVEQGKAGWGAKGQVKLKDILDLRKT